MLLYQDMVAEHGVHHGMAGWANLLGAFQTPLRVLHEPRLSALFATIMAADCFCNKTATSKG